MRYRNYRLIGMLAAVTICGGELQAKKKNQKTNQVQPQDQITIDAHIAATSGPITRFIATKHYDRSYIYAEHGPGAGATLIDITQPGHPVVLAEMVYPAGADSGSLVAIAGTAALAGSGPSGSTVAAQPRTMRIMDFSDPSHPEITRQFDGVTAMANVADRGVILLANPEGIWILTEHLAQDPEAGKRYARKVVYGDSMY